LGGSAVFEGQPRCSTRSVPPAFVPRAGAKGLAGLVLRLPRIEFLLEPQCIGTVGAALAGDVAIDSGLITQVGGKAGSGRREIDADGLLVTPGWIDVHTLWLPKIISGLAQTPRWAILASGCLTS